MTILTINGIEVQSDPNRTILEAAESAGITIPTLCRHKDLSSTGACRMCLVNVKNAKGLITACTTPVTEGMEVETENEVLANARRSVLKLLLSVYHDSGYTRDESG